MRSNWFLVSLKEITSILGDGLHGTPKYDESGEYFFINGNNLHNGSIIITEKTKRASKSEFEKYKKDLNDRTILVSINGTLGNIAFYNGEKVFLGKSACYFNVNPEIDKHYVRYVLESKLFQDYVHNLATGSTIKNVSLKLMKDFSFKLPPKDIQESISRVLKDLDDKVQNNHKTNQTLEQIAQALFKSWFVDFDPVKAKINGEQPIGMDEATASLFPEQLVESELGLNPEGWEVGELSDLMDFNPKRTLKKGTVAPYLDMKNMPTAGHLALDIYDREMGSGTKFVNGDVLLARITPCLENGKTTYVDFLEDEQVGWGSTEYIVMRSKSDSYKYFSYFMARFEPFRKFAIQSMTGTSGRQRAQAKTVQTMPFVIPTLSILEKFDELITANMKLIKRNGDENKTLAQLRDTLLPKLLSGEINLQREVSE